MGPGFGSSADINVDVCATLGVPESQAKKLEPQEHAELHDAFTIGRADLAEGITASFSAIHFRGRTTGVGVAEVRVIKEVLSFRANLQVEPLGELEDPGQTGI